MVSPDQLSVFLNLQKAILDAEDSSSALNTLLSRYLQQLNALNYYCEFMAGIFFDNNLTPKHSLFYNVHNPTASDAGSIVNLAVLLNRDGPWLKQLLLTKPIFTAAVSQVLFTNYFDLAHIQSLIISPVFEAKILVGVLILGSARKAEEFRDGEIELVSMVTNLTALAYKLQNTQTSLVNITQEVYKMNAQLHQLDKLKDDFVSIASHELRTPMTAIRSYVWMAINRSDIPLSEKLKKYLSRTLISTERLINLVNDMLNISRIESGRIEVIPQPFDLQFLASDVLGEIDPKARERGVHLQMVPAQLPKVFADSDKVHQVLLNLLGNALKFTPAGGMVTVSFFSDGKVAEVAVKDSGVGISAEDLPRLFKKFGRLDNSYVAAATSGGTGLGLFISRSLVELMGGKIWANSEGLNKGSVFIFSLPVATPQILAEAEKYTKKVEGEAKKLEPVAI